MALRQLFVKNFLPLLWLILVLGHPIPAFSHAGAPYPIIVDHPAPPYGLLSVWADPDVGTGTFTILLSLEEETSPATVSASDIAIDISTLPLDRQNIPLSFHQASRKPFMDQGDDKIVFVAEIPFDHEGPWNVGFALKQKSQPGRPAAETAVDVEVTPPGPAFWELWVYLMPFILFGGLWVKVFLKRRQFKKLNNINI